jgi:hypothetical protein
MGGRRVFFFIFPQVNGKKIRGVFCKNVQSIATMTATDPGHASWRNRRARPSRQKPSNPHKFEEHQRCVLHSECVWQVTCRTAMLG